MSKKNEPKDTQIVEFHICDACPNQPICKEGRACRYYRGWVAGHKPDIHIEQYIRKPSEVPGLSESERRNAHKLFLPKVEILQEIFAEAD